MRPQFVAMEAMNAANIPFSSYVSLIYRGCERLRVAIMDKYFQSKYSNESFLIIGIETMTKKTEARHRSGKLRCVLRIPEHRDDILQGYLLIATVRILPPAASERAFMKVSYGD